MNKLYGSMTNKRTRSKAPLMFSEKGLRDKNEDYVIHTELLLPPGRLMVLCDGVGGAASGEIASRIIARQIAEYFEIYYDDEPLDEAFLQRTLTFAKAHLDYYACKYSYSKGMATTLALAYVSHDKVLAAWLGDSRIYHIRDGKILWKSDDHNLITQLSNNGFGQHLLKNLPFKNLLTKFIRANSPVPPIDSEKINDLVNDDYIVLISDGVLEGLEEQQLVQILAGSKSNEHKINAIKWACEEHAHDNFSAIIYQV